MLQKCQHKPILPFARTGLYLHPLRIQSFFALDYLDDPISRPIRCNISFHQTVCESYALVRLDLLSEKDLHFRNLFIIR